MSTVRENRACWNADGSRKRGYPNRKQAKETAMKHQDVYRCMLHGWHVGSHRGVAKKRKEMTTNGR